MYGVLMIYLLLLEGMKKFSIVEYMFIISVNVLVVVMCMNRLES